VSVERLPMAFRRRDGGRDASHSDVRGPAFASLRIVHVPASSRAMARTSWWGISLCFLSF